MQWNLSLKDTISVLGNLIENSIEAVEDVPSHKKWIEIAFTNIPDSDSLQLCISNPFLQKEPFEGEVIKKGMSTKGKDRGYGLYIVEKKVKMYHGELRVYVKGDVFMTVIDI